MKKLMLLLFPVFLIAALSFIFTTPIPAKLKSFIGLSDSRATEKSSMSNDVAKNVNVDERVKKEIRVCKSFEKDRASYYLDEKNVYVEDKVLDGADPKTFIFLANYEHDIGSISYAKDKSNVYFNCGEVYA